MKGAKCIKDSFESQSVQLSATGLPPTIDHLKFQNCLGKVEPSVCVLVHFFDHPPKAEISLLHKEIIFKHCQRHNGPRVKHLELELSLQLNRMPMQIG